MTRFGRLGTIGRFKPLHLGGASMLEAVCENADHAIIGIGSCNRYDARNPFTAQETKEMIDAYLRPRFQNYEIKFIEDFGCVAGYDDGQRWREEILHQYGTVDAFVSGDTYVQDLLKNDYQIITPYDIIRLDRQVWQSATDVRVAMAKGEDWKRLVPREVAQYMETHGLNKRFVEEFGEETRLLAANGMHSPRTVEEERRCIQNLATL